MNVSVGRMLIAGGLLVAVGTVRADAIGNVGEVKLKGYLGERLDRMVERHVGGTDIDYITAPFLEKTERKNWWQTEFWGKYMHAAVPYAAYSGSPKIASDISRGAGRMLASQERDGYIGNYPDELRCGEGWDVWGMKYTLMGLMHCYDYMCRGNGAGRGNVLSAAKRLCDYVIGEMDPAGSADVSFGRPATGLDTQVRRYSSR